MKKTMIVLAILLSLSFVIGCSGYGNGDENAREDTASVTGADVYNMITEDSDYRQWDLWPGAGEFYESSGAHGELLTTYVTEDAKIAIENREGVLPEGSIVVKEGYTSDRQLSNIVVMYKVEGYDPEHNDWFWASYSPEGEVLAEGQVDGCINCHNSAKDNDYLFTSDIG